MELLNGSPFVLLSIAFMYLAVKAIYSSSAVSIP